MAPLREVLTGVTRVAASRPLSGMWRPRSTLGGVERRIPVVEPLDWEDDVSNSW